MRKKSRNISFFDSSCPTAMLGISSVATSYELAHFINKALGISLARMADFIQYPPEKLSSLPTGLFGDEAFSDTKSFPHHLFYYESEVDKLMIMLIKNVVDNDKIITEYDKCDYLLLLIDFRLEYIETVKNVLSNVDRIHYVFRIDEKKVRNWNDIIDELSMYALENNE